MPGVSFAHYPALIPCAITHAPEALTLRTTVTTPKPMTSTPRINRCQGRHPETVLRCGDRTELGESIFQELTLKLEFGILEDPFTG